MRHAHRGTGRDAVAVVRGWVGIEGRGDRGDTGAPVRDGDADAEGFLNDGPEIGLLLQGREVEHAFRILWEGGSELLLQES